MYGSDRILIHVMGSIGADDVRQLDLVPAIRQSKVQPRFHARGHEAMTDGLTDVALSEPE